MQRWNEVFSGEEVTGCGIKEETASLKIRGKRRMKMKERPICRLLDHYSWIFPRGLVFPFQLPRSCTSLMADLCLQTFSLVFVLPILLLLSVLLTLHHLSGQTFVRISHLQVLYCPITNCKPSR